MKDDFDNVYDMLEHAIEYAFVGKMQLKFYEFLKYRKTKKAEIDSFLESSTAKEIADEVLELQEYIKGGNDKLNGLRRETMFIQILEGLHPLDAEILTLVKDKNLYEKYKITKENVIEAYPDIQWGNRS